MYRMEKVVEDLAKLVEELIKISKPLLKHHDKTLDICGNVVPSIKTPSS